MGISDVFSFLRLSISLALKRKVCPEAFRKRRYEKAFVAKLSDSEGEAAESQVWLEFALKCNYLTAELHKSLNDEYNLIIGKIVNMIRSPEKWKL